jgi:soluble lytic murein transglycosylase-like protein
LVIKKGGVSYITSRENPRSNQAGMNTSELLRVRPKSQTRPLFPGTAALIQKPNQDHNLRTSIIKAVIRMDSAFNCKAASPQGAQGLSQLRLRTAADFMVVNP